MIYLALLLWCGILLLAYQGWLAWILLMALLWMPLLTLLVSLPAMLSIRLRLQCAGNMAVGTKAHLMVRTGCLFPVPECRIQFRVRRTITGEQWLLTVGDRLPTEHCGQLVCTPEKCWVYDYLGLFRLPIRHCGQASVIVEPMPVEMPMPAQLEQQTAKAWRPKPGGGFSENHELRLYRPGDNLNQLHWKLSAKTGKLIIREAMEPLEKRLRLTLALRGSPEGLDAMLGKLLWLGRQLLQEGRDFEIHALNAQGTTVLPVTCPQELTASLRSVLCMKPAPTEAVLPPEEGARSFCIGGATDEA